MDELSAVVNLLISVTPEQAVILIAVTGPVFSFLSLFFLFKIIKLIGERRK